MGLYGATIGIAVGEVAIGPLVGGALTESLGYLHRERTPRRWQ